MLNDLLLLFGGLVILGLLPFVILRARALERRIQDQLSQDEQGPKDPYAQMAEFHRVQGSISRQEGSSWPKD